nr:MULTISPECIES: hypothetical protein [Thioalkalivibrio]
MRPPVRLAAQMGPVLG